MINDLTLPSKYLEKFSAEEVRTQSIYYFHGDVLAAEVWMSKYALKDSHGNFYERSPEEMHRRLARELARIEAKYPAALLEDEIYDLLKDFTYIIPQGGPMAGIGNDFQYASLSNCFVIGVDEGADSYGSVLSLDQELVQLMKRRGGVGVDLSHIRPEGSVVNNSALTATGIVAFMHRFSNSTREVAQGGRRGALMLSLSVKHPEAISFAKAKANTTAVTGANISLKLDDEFMLAVEEEGLYRQQFPIDSQTPAVEKETPAIDIWKTITEGAWRSAEPGVIFWDTVIRESLPDCYADEGFQTVSTNPCGEIPLCPYDSCRLMAINLSSYVENPFLKDASFNFERFKQHVRIALRLMDDLVDLELEKITGILKKIDNDPEPEQYKQAERSLWLKIKEKCENGRRTGLGITGLGDMVASLGLKYGSDDSIIMAEKVQSTLATEAYRSSMLMAKERGAFPIFNMKKEENNPFLKRIGEKDPELVRAIEKYGRRNMAMLTIAPTGSTSLLSQTTSGVEPAFRLYYSRRKKVNDPNPKNNHSYFVDDNGDCYEEYPVFHYGFKKWLQTQGLSTEEIETLRADDLKHWVEKSPYDGASSDQIPWKSKVKLQSVLQKWVDHSISVTVNLPEETPESTISNIYLEAWKKGCKGITVYREGSRAGILVSETKKTREEFADTNPPKRPLELEAVVLQFKNDQEYWVAVVGLFNGKPYEIFTGRAEDSFSILSTVKKGKVIKSKSENGKNRYDFQYLDKDGYKVTIEGLSRTFNKEYWNYAKLISGVLRHGMPLKYVIEMIEDLYLDGQTLNTWRNGVKRALLQFIPDGTTPTDNQCPNCKQAAMVYQESCLQCSQCGYSKCG